MIRRRRRRVSIRSCPDFAYNGLKTRSVSFGVAKGKEYMERG